MLLQTLPVTVLYIKITRLTCDSRCTITNPSHLLWTYFAWWGGRYNDLCRSTWNGPQVHFLNVKYSFPNLWFCHVHVIWRHSANAVIHVCVINMTTHRQKVIVLNWRVRRRAGSEFGAAVSLGLIGRADRLGGREVAGQPKGSGQPICLLYLTSPDKLLSISNPDKNSRRQRKRLKKVGVFDPKGSEQKEKESIAKWCKSTVCRA